MHDHVQHGAAVATLTDTGLVEHLVGWAGDLQIMRRHHDRDVCRMQCGENGWGLVVIDIMQVSNVRLEVTYQHPDLSLRLPGVDNLRSHLELLR